MRTWYLKYHQRQTGGVIRTEQELDAVVRVECGEHGPVVVTGAMSSFLDNTPTYLVFLTTAGTLGATAGLQTSVGIVPQVMLEAISCGAVFMGANTYIGNAPNFMVKSIAEENGIRMPSFFGYMTWSLRFLIPVFVVDMLIFFL